MKIHEATEQAYKNGYAKGYADAIAFTRNELKPIKESVKECLQKGKEIGVVISNLETTTKWIPVTERLPEPETEVLTYRESGIQVEFWWKNYWDNDEFTSCPVTHWMPLPEPPRDGE